MCFPALPQPADAGLFLNGNALIGTSSAFGAASRFSGYEDTLHDSATWIDIASSIHTAEADGSVHEAAAATNICGAEDGSLETTIATRVSQAGKPGMQSFKADDALIGTSSAFSAASRFSGSGDILRDSAPRIDIAFSIRTVDADGSVHEADAGTNLLPVSYTHLTLPTKRIV